MGSLDEVDIAKKKNAMWLYPKVSGFYPSERWGHSACYSNGSIFVFGGCCGGTHFSDVLVLNLNSMAWTSIATTGQAPGPRDSHSAVLMGRRMIVFGGTNGSKKVNDLHVLDLETREWMQPECGGVPPSPRESHSATLVGDDKMVVFGGSGEGETNYLNDLHVLDLKTMRWTTPVVKGDIPVPRDSHSAIAIGDKLFVYGGDCGDRYHGAVEMLDVNTFTWTRLNIRGSSPGVRAGHAAVNIRAQIYIIGGVGDKHYYNDVWILNVSTCSWTLLDVGSQQPQGRFSHTAVVTDSGVVIYGGCGEDECPISELLVLQLGAEHPSAQYNISTCKIFGNLWNQEKTKLHTETQSKQRPKLFGSSVAIERGDDELDLESVQPIQIGSDFIYPKRRRVSRVWKIESEQEEHSHSLSQHSSPSHSDQEQTPGQKLSNSSKGFNLFKQLSHSPQNSQLNCIASNLKDPRISVHRSPPEHQYVREPHNYRAQIQFPHAVRQRTSTLPTEQKLAEAGPVSSLIGADVRGKVDGAFDCGLLMTASVNGKIFRGVLFAPGPMIVPRSPMPAQNPSPTTSNIASAHPFLSPNHLEYSKPLPQPTKFSMPESGNFFRQAHLARPSPALRASLPFVQEPKLKSDLQGVVLTLGTGNALGGS